jgi:hypothetical protein
MVVRYLRLVALVDGDRTGWRGTQRGGELF